MFGGGDGIVIGPLAGPVYEDVECAMHYNLPCGIYIGANVRDFDVEGRSGLLDDREEILTLRGGMRF